MLAIARYLMGHPEILLLDEPSKGLAPLIGRGIFAVIKKLNESGTIILLGEQNAKAALNVAKRDFVFETEANVLEGLATDLFADPKVQEAYLGD